MSELKSKYKPPVIDCSAFTSLDHLGEMSIAMLEAQRAASHAYIDDVFNELRAENAARIEAILEREKTGAITH